MTAGAEEPAQVVTPPVGLAVPGLHLHPTAGTHPALVTEGQGPPGRPGLDGQHYLGAGRGPGEGPAELGVGAGQQVRVRVHWQGGGQGDQVLVHHLSRHQPRQLQVHLDCQTQAVREETDLVSRRQSAVTHPAQQGQGDGLGRAVREVGQSVGGPDLGVYEVLVIAVKDPVGRLVPLAVGVAGAGGLVGGAALGLAVTQPPPRRSCSP